MGLCQSTKPEPVITPEVDDGKDIFSQKLYRELNLSQDEVSTLRIVFNKMDIDKSGEIACSEFLSYFDIHPTSLNLQLFILFDFDGSGAMNFVEFVCAMCVNLYKKRCT